MEKLTAEEARNRAQKINARIRLLGERIQRDIDERDNLDRKLEEIQRYRCPHENDVIDPIPKGSNFYTVRCTDCGTTEQGITEDGITYLRANGGENDVTPEMVEMATDAKARAEKGEKK